MIEDLKVLYSDLNRLIVEYDTSVPWLGKKVQKQNIISSWKMATDQKYLYICQWGGNCVLRYTIDGLELIDKFPLTSNAAAVDISDDKLYIYRWDRGITVFNINTKVIIREWCPPAKSVSLKIYDNHLYYASQVGTIYVYSLSGDLIKQYDCGKKGIVFIFGIDIDDKFIFIAERNKCQIQVYHIENGQLSHQWGNKGIENGLFTLPNEVRLYQELCCVGDQCGIQVFTKEGDFLCRFGKTSPGNGEGEFKRVVGILMIGNRLYTSEEDNNRLMIFQ